MKSKISKWQYDFFLFDNRCNKVPFCDQICEGKCLSLFVRYFSRSNLYFTWQYCLQASCSQRHLLLCNSHTKFRHSTHFPSFWLAKCQSHGLPTNTVCRLAVIFEQYAITTRQKIKKQLSQNMMTRHWYEVTISVPN